MSDTDALITLKNNSFSPIVTRVYVLVLVSLHMLCRLGVYVSSEKEDKCVGLFAASYPIICITIS